MEDVHREALRARLCNCCHAYVCWQGPQDLSTLLSALTEKQTVEKCKPTGTLEQLQAYGALLCAACKLKIAVSGALSLYTNAVHGVAQLLGGPTIC